jgi:4-hydroxy-tetrahydrodipicolinate reductase
VKTRVLVNAGAGKMGRRVISLLLEDAELSLAGVREVEGHPAVGSDAGQLVGENDLGVPVVAAGGAIEEGVDVAIDFSAPAATLALAEQLGQGKIPLVSGTTGLTDSERAQLSGHMKGVACVLAPNMSMGVNVLFKLAHDVTRILGETYDIEIVEAHHRFKADAPSGTALRLGEEVARAREVSLKEKATYGREGRCGARTADEVAILAVRAGDIVGEHTVIFGGLGERIELVHKAHTRDNFALGALRAAKWVTGQPAGMYDMMDVLGIR